MKRAALTLLLLCVTAGAFAQPCTYSMSPTDLSSVSSAGGLVTITVTTPTTCAVTVSSFQPWVTFNGTINNGATTTVTLQVASNSGVARSTSIKVADRLFQVAQNASGGGGGPWDGVCPGYPGGGAYTRVLTTNWASPQPMLTSSVGGFSVNDIVVVQFTTGNFPSGNNTLLKITGAEYIPDPPAQRIATLSDQPCSFTGVIDPSTGHQYPGSYVPSPGSTSITLPFEIDNPKDWGLPGYYPILHVNTTYYLNVKMPPDACPSTNCNMRFDLLKYDNP